MSALADHSRGGSGPPLLLIHGFTATWRVWGPVRQLLEEQFDVLAPTLGGHTGGPELPGETEPVVEMLAGLEAILDEVGWEKPHVAGFSLGGRLALELAVRGRAQTCTAIAPAGAFTDGLARELLRTGRQFRRGHFAARRSARVVKRMGHAPAFRRAALRDMMVDGGTVPAEESNAMMQAFAETPVFRAFLEAEKDSEHRLAGLEKIDVPTTVVWGDSDRVLRPAKHEEFFRERLPDARFITLKKAGHLPFWEATERTTDAIAQTALKYERSAAK